MNSLQMYGWNNRHETDWEELDGRQWRPGRVTSEHRNMYTVITEDGEWLSVCSGAMLHGADDRRHYPAVGDWVAVEKMPGEERGIIHCILPRTSIFSRKAAGESGGEQLIAVNVDLVFLVTSMNDDFNIRRLERYLVAAYESGAVPVVVLTKSDLCEDPAQYAAEAAGVAAGADILIVSSRTGAGIDRLHSLLQGGKTAALLGSSGVGKSSLVNAICGDGTMAVQNIRDDDSKGRHTTTHRELIALPGGGVLIDTPGMREFQLWNERESVDSSFTDIASLAETCKFSDCGHIQEPGCAVRRAIGDGTLEESRFASYLKLQREIAYLDRKSDSQARLAERKRWKALTKAKR
ncbi:putative ribosome biogenesis GTPase RsgA [Sporosarcina sp. NCCP-2716]|uniref:ribosome small subunit-dependent GTPase A n=1 Tax=Sporosarcina sp. NCCP-2716 TaxID=2943679 RepID=UPI00203A87B1|nr:ribosome small subunit-dependent GTPase A [Sporosarcina sp. NCCP-2716]GKV68190.1 putative ribosome biogenesis GTPase RsgA [Sporosarcina sp. NCCP-2716]